MIKKTLFIGFLLLWCFCAGKAQREEADSLIALIKTLDPDTSRINALLDLSSILFRYEPDKSITYSQEAIQLSAELNYREGVAYGLKKRWLSLFYKRRLR